MGAGEEEKNEFRQGEGLRRLISKLPTELKVEAENLWLEFLKGLTKEGRFVRQADKLINFLQGMEYWKKYGKIQHRLWMRWIKEIIDDPVLLKFMRTVENSFCGRHSHFKKTR